MIKKLRFIFIAALVAVMGSILTAQNVGDFGSAASGNWSALGSWVVCQTNGDWGDAIAAGSLPLSTDNVFIRDGHTITIDQNVSIANLTVGEGTSGFLSFDGTTGREVNISGNIIIAAGGTFKVFSPLTPTGDVTAASNVISNVSSTAGIATLMNISGVGIPAGSTISLFDANTITMSLVATISGTAVPLSITPTIRDSIYIGGNLTNNGTFDMSLGTSVTICNVIFNNTTGNQTISGSGVTTRFRGVTLAKVAVANKVICSTNVSLTTLTYTAGTWEQTAGRLTSSSSIDIGDKLNAAILATLNIVGSGSLKVEGSVNVVKTIYVNTTDSVIIGTGTHKIDHTLVNGASATYTSGTILINGKILFSNQCLTLINGANIIIDPKGFSSVSNDYAVRYTTGSGSYSVTFSSGTITILNPNSFSGANAELSLNTGATITGTARFVLGQGASTLASAAGFRINVNAAAVVPAYLNHLTINTGTVGVSLLTNNLDVKGTLSLVSCGTLSLGGKILNYQSGGTLDYSGTSARTTTDFELPSTGGPTNLTINNAAGVSLHASRTLSGALTLTSGNLALNSQTLTYGSVSGSGGSISESQTLNAPSSANVGNLGALISSSADLGTTIVKRGYNAQTGNGNQGILRWYEIVPTTNTGLNATLVFPYTEGAELNGITEANLKLFRSTDNGSTWTLAGGTVDEVGNTVTLTGIDAFSRWTLGSITAPLPVELTSFSGTSRHHSIVLTWSTATELNNAGFEVERSEVNVVGGKWVKLGFVEGHGTTNVVQTYSFTDKPGAGNFQYRLKQIDRDGKFEYSSAVEVSVAATPAVLTLNDNYPNPFNPTTKIDFTVPFTGRAVVKVYNSIGQEAAVLFNGVAEVGRVYQTFFNAKNLASGMYFSRLEFNGKILVKKMLLTK